MAQHPLEPLSAEEFRSTAAILRRERGVTEAFRFASIELREPAKAEVKAWRPGDPVPRTSFATLWDRSEQKTYEAVVDLSRGHGGLVHAHPRRHARISPWTSGTSATTR